MGNGGHPLGIGKARFQGFGPKIADLDRMGNEVDREDANATGGEVTIKSAGPGHGLTLTPMAASSAVPDADPRIGQLVYISFASRRRGLDELVAQRIEARRPTGTCPATHYLARGQVAHAYRGA